MDTHSLNALDTGCANSCKSLSVLFMNKMCVVLMKGRRETANNSEVENLGKQDILIVTLDFFGTRTFVSCCILWPWCLLRNSVRTEPPVQPRSNGHFPAIGFIHFKCFIHEF